MPNNRLLTGLLASSVVVGATALAQVAPETPSLIDESETVTEPADPGLITETNPDTNDTRDSTDLETQTNTATDPADSESDLLVQGDDYRPSERVSEDRSISFPVDI
jgi:hypothetical protein